MKGFLKKAAKAFMAAAMATLGSLAAALSGSDAGLGQLTTAQWIATAAAGLAAFGAVYGIANAVPATKDA